MGLTDKTNLHLHNPISLSLTFLPDKADMRFSRVPN